MKGIFHDGPTIEPLFQMYLTVAGSAVSDTNVMDVVRTLVVRHSRYDERQEELPHIETGEDRGKEAAGVELLDDVRNFCIRRGRDETRVDRHVEVEELGSRCAVLCTGGGARVAEGRTQGRQGESIDAVLYSRARTKPKRESLIV